MRIKISLSVGQEHVLEDTLAIDDSKLENLTEDEIEGVIEIHISEWANRNVSIAWEAADPED